MAQINQNTLYSPLRYSFPTFIASRSFATFFSSHPKKEIVSKRSRRSSNALPLSAAKLSSPCNDFRTEALHSLRIRSNVRSFRGAKLFSSQYSLYWLTILCGTMVLMTFGTVMICQDDNVSLFSPNGRSCTRCGLVIKQRKRSNCRLSMRSRRASVLGTGAALPYCCRCKLALV